MKLNVLPSAHADLDHGRRFYARQGKSVGQYFLDTLFSDIDSLEIHAGIHAQVYGHHRLLSKRFPYAIYYRVEGDTCTVFRVLDCRQSPRSMTKALEGTQGR